MEEQLPASTLPRFDVRKLVGQQAYWDGRGVFLIQFPNPTNGLDRVREALTTDGFWQRMRQGEVVEAREGNALTVHFTGNDFGVSNIVVPYGQYLLIS